MQCGNRNPRARVRGHGSNMGEEPAAPDGPTGRKADYGTPPENTARCTITTVHTSLKLKVWLPEFWGTPVLATRKLDGASLV